MPDNTQLTDIRFFALHLRRQYRIRPPIDYEFEAEFRSLGPHVLDRRRVLVARVDKKRARHFGVPFARIPMLLFADESVEDTDEVVGPMFRKIVSDAGAAEGKEVIF